MSVLVRTMDLTRPLFFTPSQYRMELHSQDRLNLDEILSEPPLDVNYQVKRFWCPTERRFRAKMVNVSDFFHSSITALQEHVQLESLSTNCLMRLRLEDYNILNALFAAHNH